MADGGVLASSVPRLKPLAKILEQELDVQWCALSPNFSRVANAGRFGAVLLDFCWDPFGALAAVRAIAPPNGDPRPLVVAIGDKQRGGEALVAAENFIDMLVDPEARAMEIAIRIRRGLTSVERADEGLLTYGDFVLDRARLKAWRGQRALRLSRVQFDLLDIMMQSGGREVTRDQMADALWPEGTDGLAITACIGRLRRAIRDPDGLDPIQSNGRGGYFLIS